MVWSVLTMVKQSNADATVFMYGALVKTLSSSSRATETFLHVNHSRIPDSYDAKIAKICNLWTFCPIIPRQIL